MIEDSNFQGSERFQILERLGAGGAGEVFRALDRRFNHQVALKTLFRADATAIVRIKNEFRALADVVHPHLVQLYELLCEGDQWFFTMELIPGGDFLEYLRPDAGAAQAPTAPADLEILRLAFRQLAEGLQALHRAGKMHCDLKPSNIRVTPEGRVVLLDFGLVRETFQVDETLELAGTPAYMSPEQIGGQTLTAASDWYAVGILLFEALTGLRPHRGSFAQVLHAKLSAGPPRPRDLWAELPEDLDQLCAGLLAREPSARPNGHEVLRILGSLPQEREVDDGQQALIVGRESQLAALEQAFARTRQGQSAIAWVHGSSGMGKSSLIQRFLDETKVREPQVLILSGRCYERESVPYKALDSLVDALTRALRRLPASDQQILLSPEVVSLARLFPALESLEGVQRLKRQAFDIPDEREQRRRAAAALRELFVRLAARRPVVLTIDDLQWGDRDSAAVLIEVLRVPDPPPLLLIGSFRSEERASSALLVALLGSRQLEADAAQEVEVNELAPSQAYALARHLLGDMGPVGETLARNIAREAQGSPFFVHELVHHARLELKTQAEPNARLFLDSGDSTTTSLDRLIRARVKRLPAMADKLLTLVAVAGHPLDLGVALELADLGGEAPMAVATLRGANLVRLRRNRDEDSIEAYHDRIRETIAQRLDPQSRIGLHRRMAAALEAKGRTDPEILAGHYRDAGDSQSERTWVMVAAEQASRALAFDRAASLFERALELDSASDRSGVRHDLLIKLGDALRNAGRGFDAARAYLTAVATAPPDQVLELRRRAAEQQLISGRVDEGLETIRTVLSSLGLSLPASIGRSLFDLIWKRLRLKWRGLKFEERPSATIPAQDLLRIDTYRSVASGLANVEPMLGMNFATTHLLHALEAGEPLRVSIAFALEACYVASGGSAARVQAEALIHKASELAERVDEPQAQALAVFAEAMVAFFNGQGRRALEKLEKADTILRERCTGVSWELDTIMFYRMRVQRLVGQLREMQQSFPGSLKDALDRGDLFAETCLRSAAIWLSRLLADRPKEALAELELARAGWSQRGFHALHYVQFVGRIEIALYEGDGEAAWAILQATLPELVKARLLRVELARLEVAHMRARTALAAASARGVSSAGGRMLLRDVETQITTLERANLPYSRPMAQLDRAGVASLLGNRNKALEHLVAAAAGFDAVDFELQAVICRFRRGQLLAADGESIKAEAERSLRHQGVVEIEKFANVLAPGLWP